VIAVTTAIGYLTAAVTLSVVLLLVAVQAAFGNQHLFDPLIKAICRGLPLAFGVRVRSVGRRSGAQGDTDRPVIYMSNHVNIFDPVILYGHIPRFIRAIELEDHFSWPVWGAIVRRAGNIPISHRHPRRALASLRRAAEVLQDGTSLVVLPEGHRTRSGELGPFMRGAFRLAREVGVDIVPVALTGLYERKSVHSPLVRPGTVVVAFGRPLPAEEAATMSEQELLAHVRAEINALLHRRRTAGRS